MSRYDKKSYEWYKEHGICVQCGQEEAAQHRVRCLECLAKNTTRKRKNMDPEYAKRKRRERQEQGKCVWCGRPRAKDSKCYCTECRIKNRRRLAEKRDGIARSERPAYGMCYRCGAPINGGTLCDNCMAQSMANLPKHPPAGWIQYHRNGNRALFQKG